MRKILCILLMAGFSLAALAQKTPKNAVKQAKNTMAKPAMAFADARFVEMGKMASKLFEQGRLEEWGEYLAEDAVYLFSGGDSLSGRKAILNYWTERRAKYVSELKFSNEIFLPIEVHTSQQGPDMPGTWLLQWHQVDATYKNGKTITFWVHLAQHLNDQGKIDRTINYMDHSKIKEVLGQ